jgi:hypothetical protein
MPDITVACILDRLGGPPEAARKLSAARTTVLGWRKANAIPAARLLDVHDLTGLPIEELRVLVAQQARPHAP